MIECPKYSVIIPVYNAAFTLQRCVDSLLNQNYPDAEIILVNDGSTDDSGSICKEYARRSDAVVYIEKSNGGVSTARNAGLDAACGKYILFVDSDDFVSDQYFSKLDSLGAQWEYDCVFFSHSEVKDGNVAPKVLWSFEAETMERAVPRFCEALYRKYMTPPYNKRFTRSIIEDNHIRFPEHLYVGEDKSFSLQYVMRCGSCLVSPELLYFLCLDNMDSLSRKYRPDLYEQLEVLTALTRQTLQTVEIPDEYRRQYMAAENLIQLRAVYSEAKRMHLAGRDRKFRRKTICQMCRSNNALRAELPGGMFSRLLQIPVRLRLVTVIDLMGRYLAR